MRRKSKPAAKKKTAQKAVKKKSAARKKAKNKPAIVKKLEPKLSAEEIGSLLEQVQSEERSERAWLEMTAADADDADVHAAEEEKVLSRPQERKGGLKTWKYFGK